MRRGIDWIFIVLAATTLLLLGGLVVLSDMAYRNLTQLLAVVATRPEIVLPGLSVTAPPDTPTPTPAEETPVPTVPVAVQPTRSPTPAVTPSATPTFVALAQVPDVRGLTVAQASARLESRGLALEQNGQDWSESVAAGIIMRQSAVANSELPRGSTVVVVVSRGRQAVEVPSVVSATYADAAARLTRLGLRASRRDEWNDRVGAGTVFAQEPASGNIPAGGTVVLYVSRGPEMATVPPLIGLSEGEAKDLLARNKLKLFRWGINYQGSRDLPAEVLRRVPVGHVLSTRPEAGTLVPVGSEVEMAVRKE
ncbi:MAG: PASTA domain-containing protein [Chloroflexi bacterium]|nr:PASTA domain-containing protein [Chloroflexota bacterium]